MSNTAQRKYPLWRPGAWAQTLPDEYYASMSKHVDAVTEGWFSEKDRAEGYDEYIKARYVFGRMEIAHIRLMPWIVASIPDTKAKTVLEIGCGNGSATVPLANNFAHVHAFDIAADQIPVAQLRCDLLGISNVSLSAKTVSWIDDLLAEPRNVSPQTDVIVCYALFEHLLPPERIKLLIGAWKHLREGGYLIIIECPNRLYWFDWHSSQIPFADQLPHEILFLWNDMSPRASIPKEIKTSSLSGMMNGNVNRLYRFGRGASFHEFYVALGAENFDIAQTTYVDRREFLGYDEDAIAGLERLLARVTPPPHPAFARPSLDLIVRKTGPSRMTA